MVLQIFPYSQTAEQDVFPQLQIPPSIYSIQRENARGLYTFYGLCFITELHYARFPAGIGNFSEFTTNDFSLFVSCSPDM